MTEAQKQAALTEARQLYVAAPIIMPLLERLSLNAYQRLISGFRNGDKDNLTLIAELSVIDALKSQIRSKLEILNDKEAK